MTLVVITKTSQGYTAHVQDRTADINKEQPKANPKVIESYLNKLIGRKEQVTA